MTIQELARSYTDLFVTGKRTNGNEYLFIKPFIKTEAAENLKQLVHDAHNDMLPDDYKYQFIYEALEAISESDNPDEIQLESDVYNSDLLKWVSSHLTRASYVDEAVETWEYRSFFEALSAGQYQEKNDVLAIVRYSLEKILKDEE
jgi:hypothetical protein